MINLDFSSPVHNSIYSLSSEIENFLIRIKILSEIEFDAGNYDDFYSVDIRIQANFESFIKKYS